MIDFVCGGVSSGKSRFSLDLLEGEESVTFIATGYGADKEMKEKIALHQAERPKSWELLEEKYRIGSALSEARNDSVLMDSLSFWIFNLIEASWSWSDVEEELNHFLSRCLTKSRVVIVGDEVGLGGIGSHSLVRKFAQWNGKCNQIVAQQATEMYMIMAGRSLRLKG